MPREVGAPPGGPTLVHTQIPVVFFTQSGIPGEMTDELVSSQGPVAVCVQAMQHIGQLTFLLFVLHLHGLRQCSSLVSSPCYGLCCICMACLERYICMMQLYGFIKAWKGASIASSGPY